MTNKSILIMFLIFVGSIASAQESRSAEGTHVLALDMILADTFVSIDIDGSKQNKSEFLASIEAPEYHAPAQAVTEQSAVEV